MHFYVVDCVGQHEGASLFEKSTELKLMLQPRTESSAATITWETSSSQINLAYAAEELEPDSDSLKKLAVSAAFWLHSLLKEEQATVARKLFQSFAAERKTEDFLNIIPGEIISRIDERETRAFKHAPTYHLTFSLFTAGPMPSSWDIESVLKSHVRPWIIGLEHASNFTVTTQVQLYSAFSDSIQPFQNENDNSLYLRSHDLSAFINAAEWPLSPSIGAGPTINFVLYIPRFTQMPLRIEGSSEASWLIPQWGGISILNPPLVKDPETGVLSTPIHLTHDMLDGSFEVFASQMLSLLDVPSLKHDGRSLPLPLRLQSHTRLSAVSLFQRASSTLGSLARLSMSLGSIPIPRDVAKLVGSTMDHLEACALQLRNSRWNVALYHAREAYQDSEKAFFDKSMVGQVYFPDEHKVAVYLPLLGPIGVPLVVGLVKEVRQFIAAFRAA